MRNLSEGWISEALETPDIPKKKMARISEEFSYVNVAHHAHRNYNCWQHLMPQKAV